MPTVEMSRGSVIDSGSMKDTNFRVARIAPSGILKFARATENFHSGIPGIHATLNSLWEFPGITKVP